MPRSHYPLHWHLYTDSSATLIPCGKQFQKPSSQISERLQTFYLCTFFSSVVDGAAYTDITRVRHANGLFCWVSRAWNLFRNGIWAKKWRRGDICLHFISLCTQTPGYLIMCGDFNYPAGEQQQNSPRKIGVIFPFFLSFISVSFPLCSFLFRFGFRLQNSVTVRHSFAEVVYFFSGHEELPGN